ncbi:MAG: bifunctional enoyl-CoA hydratase/phosphate acetyltransferase [Firmicutes bacterium]|nr:bifunctional enoyl-CoA hydratase/phosphate acetyltransferase [Bacillota bacterium]
MIAGFNDLVTLVKAGGPRKAAVACAAGEEVLKAMARAQDEGIARCVLVGDTGEIRTKARNAGLDPDDFEIVHRLEPSMAVRQAVHMVRHGEADVLVKGRVDTASFLRAVLDREAGLRAGHLISHVVVLERPENKGFLLMSDAAINVAPDLRQKVEIVRNVIVVARALGINRPRVAFVAALERITPNMPATVEAAVLAKMGERGQLGQIVADGPFALDVAVSPEAGLIKGVRGEVAGKADIVVAPDIEAGNMVYKALVHLAGWSAAGVVAGAVAPIVLPSRADSAENKFRSLAFGIFLAEAGLQAPLGAPERVTG